MATVDFLHQENLLTLAGVEPETLGTEGRRQTNYATQPASSIRGRRLVVKVSDRGWPDTSSSPVPQNTVEERCTLNLSGAQASSRWCGS
ncbi:hypothetical protein TNCV_4969531 [Trichonephila clavipes]|nr:hypothetical protein TNCV_4969531 [Trichonephila clavipes]